jgi:anthranilate phosphoribosyltransferase
VVLNAGVALVVAGAVKDLADGVARAADAIETGRARERCPGLVTLFGRLGSRE